jgi:hypothetical protein
MRVFLDYLSCTRVLLLAYIYSRTSTRVTSTHVTSTRVTSTRVTSTRPARISWMRMSTRGCI